MLVKVFQDDINYTLDILWSLSFHVPKVPPMWYGCMQLIHSGSLHPVKNSDISLTLIDLNPSDPICVLSTLEYVSDYAC